LVSLFGLRLQGKIQSVYLLRTCKTFTYPNASAGHWRWWP